MKYKNSYTSLSMLLLFSVVFAGCSSRFSPKKAPLQSSKLILEFAEQKQLPSASLEAHRYKKRVQILRKRVASRWGRQSKVASRFEYVRYMDHYRARASIDFTSGRIYIETTEQEHAKSILKKAIMTTLLSPENPEKIDLFSSLNTIQKGVPFLYTRLKDHEGKPIRWRWRASKFADYLIAHKLSVHKGRKKIYSVALSMDSKLLKRAEHRSYKSIVDQQARRFGVDPALILALIKTESHFNPYATSSIPAYGLMQVVPSSAGRDAWAFIKKRRGRPSRRYLFNAQNNIEMGTAYVHILLNRYLGQIKNPKSREYCAIAAYNTGAGNVLRCFSRNRTRAFRKINALTPQRVFAHLKRHLPYAETRRYIMKVTQAKKKY